jgi:tRNA modification GTPase
MHGSPTDTIAAIATAPGVGAIGIVRMSGPDALVVADRVFRGTIRLTEAAGYSVHFGKIVDSRGEALDEGLATVFRAPQSYTGEDSVELSCHGGPVVLRSVLEAVYHASARPAEPGEFTKRAYLNGQIDLSQAEAIGELIAAGSRSAQRASVAQLQGKLGAAVRELREKLVNLCALLEIDLDFSEEGLEVIKRGDIRSGIDAVRARLAKLRDSYAVGRVYRDGILVVLAGKPNAGKSTLFNALLGEERAIVTPHPGTTRDTIEESLLVKGIVVRVTDTAGLREQGDEIESEGIRRAEATVRVADVVVVVVDASGGIDAIELERYRRALSEGQKLIVVLNKIDLLHGKHVEFSDVAVGGSRVKMIELSAKTGEGVSGLCEAIADVALSGQQETESDLFVTSKRQFEALSRGVESLACALESIDRGRTNEFLALDVRGAIQAMSEITGEVSSEDILNAIFSSFCVGK